MEYTNHKLSILILTYNEQENIKRTLDCITSLSPNDIVIVDDYSEDKTLEIIEQEAKNYPEIKWKVVQRKLNGNFSDQRNIGIDNCEGDWILVADADETFSESIKWNLQWMMDEPEVLGWAWARIHLYPDTEHFLYKSYPDAQVRFFRNKKELRYKNEIHELPYIQDKILATTQYCRYSKNVTIIHWALLKDEKSLIEKGIRWEQFAEKSRNCGFDIGINNPRRFCFKDHENDKEKRVPRDLVDNHRYITYP
jgi:glycosyltransferase involved in cell wall biosynthesis